MKTLDFIVFYNLNLKKENKMDIIKSGKKINQGKTKTIWKVKNHPDLVIIENHNNITKNDDPSQTEQMEKKSVYATTTTCAVFDLLKRAGIPVAYEKQISETEFLAQRCKMIHLEVVGRRYAVGSYLKRFPPLCPAEGQVPYKFPTWNIEFFLKTVKGTIRDKNNRLIGNTPPDALSRYTRPIDDPLIVSPYANTWELTHPKIPKNNPLSYIDTFLNPEQILPNKISIIEIESLSRSIFALLEKAFSQLKIKLIDIKIELGVNKQGILLLADVIDNDSWRIRDENWKELSKQLFRDNVDMDIIQDKYILVANLAQAFEAM